jgi:hypothetical protein
MKKQAGVAQLVEHLICNQRVGGSTPSASSMFLKIVSGKVMIGGWYCGWYFFKAGWCSALQCR